MKTWVAHNKTVPLEILRVLAADSDPSVRYAVAFKRKLDDAMFEALAADGDEEVRQRVAYNPKAPISVLERLAADASAFVSVVAAERLLRRRG
jgi:hypothetical protein